MHQIHRTKLHFSDLVHINLVYTISHNGWLYIDESHKPQFTKLNDSADTMVNENQTSHTIR